MRETIDKLDEKVRQFITYDSSIFNLLPNNETILITSGSERETVKRNDNSYVWTYKLTLRNTSVCTFIDKKLYSIHIVNIMNDLTLFQLYVGDKKYLINCDWFDKIDFEAQAFQIDTTTRFDFSLLTVNSILKNLGA